LEATPVQGRTIADVSAHVRELLEQAERRAADVRAAADREAEQLEGRVSGEEGRLIGLRAERLEKLREQLASRSKGVDRLSRELAGEIAAATDALLLRAAAHADAERDRDERDPEEL
jgi:hypothetical protein